MSKQPLGTINAVYFFQDDIDFCKKMIARYLVDAKHYAQLEKTAAANQRGAYAQKAAQAQRDVDRMTDNLNDLRARIGKFGAVVPPTRGGDWIE